MPDATGQTKGISSQYLLVDCEEYPVDPANPAAATRTAPAGYFQIKNVDLSEQDRAAQHISVEAEASIQSLIKYINSSARSLLEVGDPVTESAQRTIKERDSTLRRIRLSAKEYLEGGDYALALRNIATELGRFEGASGLIRDFEQFIRLDIGDGDLVSNISINPASINLVADQQAMLVEIDRAQAVAKVVLNRRETITGQLYNWIRARIFQFDKSAIGQTPRGARLARLDYYLRKLAHIARLGAMGDTAQFARLALASFKDEFVSLEADAVKNHYITRLGLVSTLWVVIFFSAIPIFRSERPMSLAAAVGEVAPVATTTTSSQSAAQPTTTGQSSPTVTSNSGVDGDGLAIEPFLLLAIGACAGTWLSFSLRRVSLGFADLALLEEDRLSPNSRILFVVGLTWVIGLFFQSGIIALSLNTTKIDLGITIHAILFGAVCGIAERSLAGAVSKRAETFVANIGETAPASTKKP